MSTVMPCKHWHVAQTELKQVCLKFGSTFLMSLCIKSPSRQIKTRAWTEHFTEIDLHDQTWVQLLFLLLLLYFWFTYSSLAPGSSLDISFLFSSSPSPWHTSDNWSSPSYSQCRCTQHSMHHPTSANCRPSHVQLQARTCPVRADASEIQPRKSCMDRD